MAVKQLPKISDLPEPPDRLVGDQERFDVLTFNSLKAQKKMVNEDLNKALIPALNQFAVDVNVSVDAAALSERNAHDSEEVAKRKAGEASGSAGAAKVSEDNAKVSETNALASKNAAALSAESAEADRIAAEAARDEAKDLANVGYASTTHSGLSRVDGETIQAGELGKLSIVQPVMDLINGSVQKTRIITAGTGLTGGGELAGDVTLSVKLTDSVASTDSTTAASAKAVKDAYDRGSAGVEAADNALAVANGKLPLAGGTITGPIVSSSMGILRRNTNNSYLTISGGNDWHTPGGAELTLFGHDYPGDPGLFRLGASGTGLLEGRPDGMLKWNGSPVVTATHKANFRRQGLSGTPNLLWGGTHADGNNYDLYYPDQMTVGYANKAAYLCSDGNFGGMSCKFMWNGEIETAMLAAFNSNGSQLHPVAMDRVFVGKAGAITSVVPIANGTVIPAGGTWLVMEQRDDGWLGGAFHAGGITIGSAPKGGFAIRVS